MTIDLIIHGIYDKQNDKNYSKKIQMCLTIFKAILILIFKNWIINVCALNFTVFYFVFCLRFYGTSFQ